MQLSQNQETEFREHPSPSIDFRLCPDPSSIQEVALTTARDGARLDDDALAWPEGLDRKILPGLGVRDYTRRTLH